MTSIAGPAARVQAAAEQRPLVVIGIGVVLFSIGPVLFASADASGQVIAFWRLVFGVVALGLATIGHFVSTWPLRWVPANVPPLLQLAIPFLASALAWLVLHQRIEAGHVLGGTITMVGVAGALRSPAGRRLVAREEVILATQSAE